MTDQPRLNVQFIDSARNATYDIFSVSKDDFRLIFPAVDQDIEFMDEFVARVGEEVADAVCERLFSNKQDKRSIAGIHGTLFYEQEFKKKFYPTRKASEMVAALD